MGKFSYSVLILGKPPNYVLINLLEKKNIEIIGP